MISIWTIKYIEYLDTEILQEKECYILEWSLFFNYENMILISQFVPFYNK